jgi:SWI/SNF-related matrix-associated actin-dependent regulator 1 of chromatin subfamily A
LQAIRAVAKFAAVGDQMLNVVQIGILRQAVTRLADLQRGNEDERDSAGFSNSDLPIGDVLTQNWDELINSPEAMAGVGALLAPYSRQLSEGEIAAAAAARRLLQDADAALWPLRRRGQVIRDNQRAAREARDAEIARQVAEKAASTIKVVWTGQKAVVQFPYDAMLVEAFKESFPFSARRWVTPSWEVACATRQCWDAFAEMCAFHKKTIEVTGTPVYGSINLPSGKRFDVEFHADRSEVRCYFDYGSPNFQAITGAVRSARGQFCKRQSESYWTVLLENLPQLVTAIHAIPGVDTTKVDAALEAVAHTRAAEIATASLLRINWPSHITPFDHQKTGVQFLAGTRNCLLDDDMGLGKTLQAIIACEAIRPKHEQVLIICPASLALNWKIELKKWIGTEGVVITSKKMVIPPTAAYVIVSYDTGKPRTVTDKWRVNIAKDANPVFRFLASRPWFRVIVDEAHRTKNPQSKRHLFARNLDSKGFWLLTGTPIMNRPMDLYGLLKIMRHPLANSRHEFGLRYCDATNDGFGWDYSGCSNSDELSAKLSDCMLRRTKDQCLDLPGKIRITQAVEISDKLAVANFTTIGEMMALRRLIALEKVDATWERAEDIIESDEKVLVFSEYLDVLNELQLKATKAGIGFVRIDGSVTGARRQAVVEKFQNDPKVRMFIGQTIAAGEGITLTASTYTIFNDIALVPAYHAQAEDRSYRIGQKKKVTITYMLSNALIDGCSWEMLAGKIEVARLIENGLGDYQVAQKEGAAALFHALKSARATPRPNDAPSMAMPRP